MLQIPVTRAGLAEYKKNLVRTPMLKAQLCKHYHMHSDVKKMTPELAQEELARRLIFEISFDLIPIEYVLEGKWLDRRLRNIGHTERMRRLWTKAKRSPIQYSWITMPKYISI